MGLMGLTKRHQIGSTSNLPTEPQVIAWQESIRRDPSIYFRTYLGIKHWWSGMERMTAALPEAIKSGKPIVIGSGHALSKDFLMSGAVPLWFMHAYGPQAIAIMTAPTDRQVKKVMWGEL